MIETKMLNAYFEEEMVEVDSTFYSALLRLQGDSVIIAIPDKPEITVHLSTNSIVAAVMMAIDKMTTQEKAAIIVKIKALETSTS